MSLEEKKVSDEFKVDINIPKKDITTMAKQVIKELVENKINEIMTSINVEEIINQKINDININKIVTDVTRIKVSNMERQIREDVKNETRKVIAEEIAKKPLTGDIYLKIDRMATSW